MTFEILDLQQGTPEWLAFRKRMIMATDAPKIMGVSPYGTPLSLWEEKMGLKEPDPTNKWMERGAKLEEEARDVINKRFKANYKPIVAVSNIVPFIGASLDGYWDNKAIEIKCPGSKDHIVALNGMIPEKYIPQLQHQMFVLGLKFMLYVSYVNPDDWVAIPVTRNQKYIDDMLEKEKIFWGRILNCDPPEPSPGDYTLRNDEVYANAVRNWFHAKKKYEEAKAHEEQCKAALLEEIKYHPTKGCGVTVRNVYKKGAVDLVKIPHINGVDLTQYRKNSSQFWRIIEE